MDTCKVIQVIESTIRRRGKGQDFNDPIRIVTEYYSLDGEKLAEVDPCDKEIKFNKAEEMAISTAKKLLKEFCTETNIYNCVEGKVNINELFNKICHQN